MLEIAFLTSNPKTWVFDLEFASSEHPQRRSVKSAATYSMQS
jgi:hypothetical protein